MVNHLARRCIRSDVSLNEVGCAGESKIRTDHFALSGEQDQIAVNNKSISSRPTTEIQSVRAAYLMAIMKQAVLHGDERLRGKV